MIRHAVFVVVLFTTLHSEAQGGEVVALVRVGRATAGGVLVNEQEFTVFQETQATRLMRSPYILKKAVAALDQETLKSLGEEDSVAALERRLQMEFPNRSEIMKVSLAGISADQADKMVAIVDTVVQVYLDEFNALVDADIAFRRKELQEQRDVMRQTIDALTVESQRALEQTRPPALAEELQRRSVFHFQKRVQKLIDEKLKCEIEVDILSRLGEDQAGREEQRALHRARIAVLEIKIQEQLAEQAVAVEQVERIQAGHAKLASQTAQLAQIREQIEGIDAAMEALKLQRLTTPRAVLLQKASYVK